MTVFIACRGKMQAACDASGWLSCYADMQVLSILDASANSWPGLGAAVSDLESLIGLSAKRALAIEAQHQQLQQSNAKLEGQLTGLHHSIAGGVPADAARSRSPLQCATDMFDVSLMQATATYTAIPQPAAGPDKPLCVVPT